MKSIYTSIDELTSVLQKLTPANLRPEVLDEITKKLESIDIHSWIEAYHEESPEIRDSDKEDPEFNQKKQNEADRLNKALTPLREAIEEIRQIRHTLNLEALDPILHHARQILRSLYDLSASMNKG